MKRISKWLVPGFMWQLDNYLIENYPVIWRTRGHFVLFYGILLVSLSLTINIIFFYNTGDDNIILDINIVLLSYLSIGIFLYWARTQYLFKISIYSFKNLIITFATYFFCLIAILVFGMIGPSYLLIKNLIVSTWGEIGEFISASMLICLLLLSAPFMSFRTVVVGIVLILLISNEGMEGLDFFAILSLLIIFIICLFFLKKKQFDFVLYLMYLTFIFSIGIIAYESTLIYRTQATGTISIFVSEIIIFFILVLSYKTLILPKVK